MEFCHGSPVPHVPRLYSKLWLWEVRICWSKWAKYSLRYIQIRWPFWTPCSDILISILNSLTIMTKCCSQCCWPWRESTPAVQPYWACNLTNESSFGFCLWQIYSLVRSPLFRQQECYNCLFDLQQIFWHLTHLYVSILWCDNDALMVWLCLDKKMSWCLVKNIHLCWLLIGLNQWSSGWQPLVDVSNMNYVSSETLTWYVYSL